MPKIEEPLWSPAAEQDLDAIWDFYAENASVDTATRIVEEIEAAANRVAAHPGHGRSRSEIAVGLRSVRSAPYLVFYRAGPTFVEIVRVLHERRDLVRVIKKGEP